MDKVLESLKFFPEQSRQAWQESQEVSFGDNYQKATALVIAGMGASCFGYYFLKTTLGNYLKIPLVLANSYSLPRFCYSQTLVIAQSYSGTTEETISCLLAGLEKKTLLCGTSVGGELGEILTQNKLPYYQINPQFNPSGQPRYGLGYTIFGLLGCLVKIGLLSLSESEIKQAFNFVEEDLANIDGQAKEISRKLQNKIPLIFSAEHLAGNAHIWRNQINESSKSLADYNLLPELNHHLLEGLANPPDNKNNLIVLGLTSSLYSDKIKKRLELTREVVEKNKIEFMTVEAKGVNTLEQSLWMLSLGGFISFYLAEIYKVDPAGIPWVDYFKKRLKEE